MKIKDLEVGDKVRHTGLFVDGGIGTILKMDNERNIRVYFEKYSGDKGCCLTNLALLSKGKGKKKEKEALQWSFNTVHEKDIDWDEVAQDLSRRNPIALVTVTGPTKPVPIMITDKEIKDRIEKTDPNTGKVITKNVPNPDYYILIHDSIIKKAQCLNDETVDPRINSVIKLSNNSEFAMWVDIVKQIKHKKWPTKGKIKGKVSVVLPNI